MSQFKIGDIYTLNRNPFILKGVIVQYHSKVKLLSINNDECVVEYTDKEGYTHEIHNVKLTELVS